MAGKIEVVSKWMPFVKGFSDKDSDMSIKDSAWQMMMTLVKAIELNVNVDMCDVDDAMQSVESISYALKNIENDTNVDIHKRRAFAHDLSEYITEQQKLFGNMCVCSKR